MHRALEEMSSSIGGKVALAAALYHSGDCHEAESILATFSSDQIKSYQPYWVLKTFLEAASDNEEGFFSSRQVALGLTEDLAVRDYLKREWGGE